ncbi:MAG: hypothetical protein WCG98_03180 [bacterium]
MTEKTNQTKKYSATRFILANDDMLLDTYKQYFAEILNQETKLPIDDIFFFMIETPPENIPGDFAFPCFSLSKWMKKSPNAVAQEMAQKLKSEHFEKFEAIG